MSIRCNKYNEQISLGITLWYHNHYSDYLPKHFHLIIDFFKWYIEITIGKEVD